MRVRRIPPLSRRIRAEGAIPIRHVSDDAKGSPGPLLGIIIGIVYRKSVSATSEGADVKLRAVLRVHRFPKHVTDSDMVVSRLSVDPFVHVGSEPLGQILDSLRKALEEKIIPSCDWLLAVESVRRGETVDESLWGHFRKVLPG